MQWLITVSQKMYQETMQIYFEMIKQLSDKEEFLKTFSRNGEIRTLADARASSYQSKQNTSLLAGITLYI